MDKNMRENSRLLQLVSFIIGTEEFAIDIVNVREINRMMQITNVPNAPGYVEGVINLRGRIIPVIDLRKKLGLAGKEHDKNTRIIVVEVINTTVGFVVDAVKEVIRIHEDITEIPPATVAGTNSEYIKSIGKLEDRLLILLDLEKLLNPEKISHLEKVA